MRLLQNSLTGISIAVVNAIDKIPPPPFSKGGNSTQDTAEIILREQY
jgi:hypothetical protein